jgi:hypothetical protein
MRTAVCLAALLMPAAAAHAQELEPRTHSNAPVGLN